MPPARVAPRGGVCGLRNREQQRQSKASRDTFRESRLWNGSSLSRITLRSGRCVVANDYARVETKVSGTHDPPAMRPAVGVRQRRGIGVPVAQPAIARVGVLVVQGIHRRRFCSPKPPSEWLFTARRAPRGPDVSTHTCPAGLAADDFAQVSSAAAQSGTVCDHGDGTSRG